MTKDTGEQLTPSSDGLSAEALSEWGHHVESVLRGVAHALNNRAAALSAVIELAREPGGDPAPTGSILSTELDRISELAVAVRLIGSPRRGMEAFAPRDAATEAGSVLNLHDDRRERPLMFDVNGAPPVRVPRWMFVRALIALGAGADRSVTASEDGDWVVVRAPERAGASGAASPLVRELALQMGGEPLGAPPGFRVPTLAALRQREAR